MAKKRRYYITALASSHVTLNVIAISEAEALRLAREAPVGDWATDRGLADVTGPIVTQIADDLEDWEK